MGYGKEELLRKGMGDEMGWVDMGHWTGDEGLLKVLKIEFLSGVDAGSSVDSISSN